MEPEDIVAQVSETSSELRLSVGWSAPGKITFFGNYTIYKDSLEILDRLTGKYV